MSISQNEVKPALIQQYPPPRGMLDKSAIGACYQALRAIAFLLGYDGDTLPIGSDLELREKVLRAIKLAEGHKP